MDRIILTTIRTLLYFLVYYCLFPTPGSHPQGFTYRLVTSSRTSFVTNLTILEESRARTLPWDLSFIYLSQLDGLRGRGSQRESINPLGPYGSTFWHVQSLWTPVALFPCQQSCPPDIFPQNEFMRALAMSFSGGHFTALPHLQLLRSFCPLLQVEQ